MAADAAPAVALVRLFDSLDKEKKGRLSACFVSHVADSDCEELLDFCRSADLDDDGIVTRKEWLRHVDDWITAKGGVGSAVVKAAAAASASHTYEKFREVKRKLREMRVASTIWDTVKSDGEDEQDGIVFESTLRKQDATRDNRTVQVGQRLEVTAKHIKYLCEITSMDMDRDYPYLMRFVDGEMQDKRVMINVEKHRIICPLWIRHGAPFQFVDAEEDVEPEAVLEMFGSGMLPRPEQLMNLVRRARAIFASEPVLAEIQADTKEALAIFGDIHGDLQALAMHCWMLENPQDYFMKEVSNEHIFSKLPAPKVLFLGDLVDRGEQSIEVLTLCLAWKIMFPDRVHILRGNHEDVNMTGRYGFMRECEEKLGSDYGTKFFRQVNNLFSYLPLAAVVSKCLFCCHGGIGPTVNSLADIQGLGEDRPIALEVPPETSTHELVQALMWADPVEDGEVELDERGFGPNASRSLSYVWSASASEVFLRATGLELIVRGHQCRYEGYDYNHNGKVLTIFSSPGYSNLNAAAVFLFEGRAAQMRYFRLGPDCAPLAPTATRAGSQFGCSRDRRQGGDKPCDVCAVA